MALPKLYEQITWVNDTTPALNEDNLNAMSQALDDIDDRVIDLAGTIMEDVPQIQEYMEILGPAVENIDANVARAETAADNADAEALKSEGYAVGTQDGVEVTSGEYYQNNAKYYAEIANPPIENTVDFTDIIAISDAINKAAKDVRLKVEAVQDLHGYTKPWVGGAGKNKLPMSVSAIKAANTLGTWNGNTYTINTVAFTILTDADNNVIGINANGTASGGNATFAIMPNTSNIFNAMILNGGASASCRIQFFDQTAASQINATGSDVTIAFNNGDTCRVSAIVNDGSTANNAILYPMIRPSGTSADFEPYTNICPITGHSEAKVARAGKNLLENTFTGGTSATVVATVTEDKQVVLNGTSTSNSIFVLNNNCKLPKALLKLTGNPSKGYLSALKYDSNGYTGIVYDDSGNGAIIDARNDADDVYYIVRIVVYTATGLLVDATYKPMISVEGGEYMPYISPEFYIIGLDGTRYGGVLDVDSGVLTLTHEMIDLGDLTWIPNGSIQTGRFDGATITGKKLGQTNVLCSHYQTVTQSAMPSSDSCIRGSDDNTNVVVVDTTKASMTGAEFKTAMSGVKLVYELATPQTIQLAPIQVYLLYGYNTLFGDCGDISLTYDASGIIHIAEAKLDTETLKTIAAASSDFADFKARIAAL